MSLPVQAIHRVPSPTARPQQKMLLRGLRRVPQAWIILSPPLEKSLPQPLPTSQVAPQGATSVVASPPPVDKPLALPSTPPQQVTEEQPYTDKDTLEVLIKKYPLLGDDKERLGLGGDL